MKKRNEEGYKREKFSEMKSALANSKKKKTLLKKSKRGRKGDREEQKEND